MILLYIWPGTKTLINLKSHTTINDPSKVRFPLGYYLTTEPMVNGTRPNEDLDLGTFQKINEREGKYVYTAPAEPQVREITIKYNAQSPGYWFVPSIPTDNDFQSVLSNKGTITIIFGELKA